MFLEDAVLSIGHLDWANGNCSR